MESEFTTDVATCYMIDCQNNDALTCALLRINISVEATCLNYAAIEEKEDEEE